MDAAVDITFPPELPVSQRRDDIAAAIRDHQVVVVAGETGSGKTTQLPKICLELGRGQGRGEKGGGIIGHTQPRRIAARSVAERIASELGTELGDVVGLPGPVHRQDESCEPHQADDRRHPAGRAPAGPRPQEVRHDHHRRGPRAQPQHRLPARVPQAAAPAPPRPQADHHVGDDRPAALRRALRRPPGEARPDRRGVRPHVPRRRPLPPPRRAARGGRGGRGDRPRPDRGDRRGLPGAGPRGTRRHPGVPPRRAGDPGHRRGAGRRASGRRDRAAVLPPLRRRAAPRLRAAHRPPHRARHQRRRDVADRARHPVRRRPRRRPYLPLLGPDEGAAAAHRGDQPGVGAASAPAGADASRPASRSGCTPRRTSRRGRSSPSRRSCAPTSPRSSSR